MSIFLLVRAVAIYDILTKLCKCDNMIFIPAEGESGMFRRTAKKLSSIQNRIAG